MSAVFSLALNHRGTDESELTLGGIDATKFTKPLDYFPIIPEATYWLLNATGFAVNGVAANVSAHSVIFDSGESHILLDKRSVERHVPHRHIRGCLSGSGCSSLVCSDLPRH